MKSSYTCAKAGFTLAEVLITLGIIGVVAAMTIPNLMSKIQWLVLKQQYKEVYSTLNQALRLVYEKADTIFECYYEDNYTTSWNQGPLSECRALYDELSEVLKVSHVCESNAYANGCIPKYKGIDTVYTDQHPDAKDDSSISGCVGFYQSNILNRNTAWVLHDGTIIGFINSAAVGSNPWTKIFFVDINGKKGPNKWGYDIFTFAVISDSSGNKLYAKQRSCMFPEKGGKTGDQMMW